MNCNVPNTSRKDHSVNFPAYLFDNFIPLHFQDACHSDKTEEVYLWKGSDINSRKPPKAACPLVQWFAINKKKEVWGVLNLTTQYEAVLLKNLHKFFNRADLP